MKNCYRLDYNCLSVSILVYLPHAVRAGPAGEITGGQFTEFTACLLNFHPSPFVLGSAAGEGIKLITRMLPDLIRAQL